MRILPVEINCLSIQDVADKNDDKFVFFKSTTVGACMYLQLSEKLHLHDSQVFFSGRNCDRVHEISIFCINTFMDRDLSNSGFQCETTFRGWKQTIES